MRYLLTSSVTLFLAASSFFEKTPRAQPASLCDLKPAASLGLQSLRPSNLSTRRSTECSAGESCLAIITGDPNGPF